MDEQNNSITPPVAKAPTPAPAPDNQKDVMYNVMPQDGRESAQMSYPSAQSSMPSDNSGSSHKWLYIIIGIIVLLALGGLAYYMLGNKTTTDSELTTTKLPKVWMTQYFSSETCLDQTTCGDDADPETDGLSNYNEFKAGTNPLNPDSDSDGLADGDEVNIYKTEATLKYTDRREIVATNDWTDGVQIKGGYDPLTSLKFTESRKQQISDDTAVYHLHEPSITTTTSAPTSTDQTASWKTYSNAEYKFEIKYPSNYSVSKTAISLLGSTQAPAFSSDYARMDFKLINNVSALSNKTTINGLTAYESPATIASSTGGISYAITFTSDKISGINVEFITSDEKNNDKVAEFKEIVKTFKFTK